MALHVSRAGSSPSGVAGARLPTPLVASPDPLARARAARSVFGPLSRFVLRQAAKAEATKAPLDALRFSRSALPLARAMRALAAGVPPLQSALNKEVQAMEPLSEATPVQLKELKRLFDSLAAKVRDAPLASRVRGDAAMQAQLKQMVTELEQCKSGEGAQGARALIACYDRLAGRPGMTQGVGTMLAEEAKTLTAALTRPVQRDEGDVLERGGQRDELGICFDTPLSYRRVHAVLVALRNEC